MKKFFRNIFLSDKFVIYIGVVVTMFCIGFAFPWAFGMAKLLLLVFLALVLIDIILLYGNRQGIRGRRTPGDKWSNGDDNQVQVRVRNAYFFPVRIRIVEEFPVQFQIRNSSFDAKLKSKELDEFSYIVHPTERGEYEYGAMNVFSSTGIGIIERRYQFSEYQSVKVYPSFLQLKKYEFYAISDRLTEIGVKKIRRMGQNTEFDQIREYVRGDDIRTINWKATARRSTMMVNQYQDEKSQNIYCLVDKGRAMKMPFDGLSLMDYAINSSLVMTNVALNKDDRAGLITFSNRIGTILKASKKKFQMSSIMEALYNQETRYQESDFGRLYRNVKWNITRRSLLLLYTNFESLVALQRQIKYLRAISKDHLLVVVFFENTELKEMVETTATRTEDIYVQTIAEKFAYEKRLIVKELRKYGIHSILTTPQNLTVNSINKYLELKARGLI